MLRKSYPASSDPPALVLDPSSLIPCGRKLEEEKQAIRALGDLLPDLDTTIYVSCDMLQVYRSKVIPLLHEHHPLPPLQAGLMRVVRWLLSHRKCVSVRACGLQRPLKIRFHVLETGRVRRYDVRGLGLEDEEDMEVLRVALATGRDTLLVTTDRHFLEDLLWPQLRARYPEESNRLKVVRPSELLRRI